jgi:hypothetical protein
LTGKEVHIAPINDDDDSHEENENNSEVWKGGEGERVNFLRFYYDRGHN